MRAGTGPAPTSTALRWLPGSRPAASTAVGSRARTTRAGAPGPGALRRTLRTLHLWLGLGAGLVFAVLGISGSVLVFQPELLRWQHPALFAEPAPDEATIAGGLARLLADPPPGVSGGDLPRAATPYWQLYTRDGGRLYLDAGAERVLLERRTDNDLLLWLRDLHTHLLGGQRGEQLAGVVGLIGLFLLLSGLYLWWPRSGGMVAQLRWFRGPPIRRWLSWHRSLGTLTLPIVLLVALTGVAMVWSDVARGVLGLLLTDSPDPTAPAVIAREPQVATSDPAHGRALLTAARTALPQAELARVSLPAADDARLVFRARSDGEWHPVGRSLVWLDRVRGASIAAVDASGLAPAARASHAIYPLHGGMVGGWPWRLAVALAGLLPAFLLVTGTLLWWQRRRNR